MPTYLNEWSKPITIGSVRMEPGVSTESAIWISNLPGHIGTHTNGKTAHVYDDGYTIYFDATGVVLRENHFTSTAVAQSSLTTAGYTISDGISKTLDTPFYNPVILSSVYLTSQTVAVPSTATGNYKIAIYATGEVYVKFNSADATAYLVPEGATLEKLCTTRIINDIRLVIEEDRAAYIHIEKAQ